MTLGQWRADAHALLSAQELWFAVFMTVLYVSLQPPEAYYLHFGAFSSLG